MMSLSGVFRCCVTALEFFIGSGASQDLGQCFLLYVADPLSLPFPGLLPFRCKPPADNPFSASFLFCEPPRQDPYAGFSHSLGSCSAEFTSLFFQIIFFRTKGSGCCLRGPASPPPSRCGSSSSVLSPSAPLSAPLFLFWSYAPFCRFFFC